MLETNAAQPDTAAPLETPDASPTSRTAGFTAIDPDGRVVRRNVPWHVMKVTALPDYQLFVEFIDGTSGLVKMREQIFSDAGGVFNALRAPEVFAAVSCTEGHVKWANGLDIAPDATYEDLQRCGLQVLR